MLCTSGFPEHGPQFYEKLAHIDVSVTTNDKFSAHVMNAEERIEAATCLQDFCKDLSLASVVRMMSSGWQDGDDDDKTRDFLFQLVSPLVGGLIFSSNTASLH
jgi:hypothetical protein